MTARPRTRLPFPSLLLSLLLGGGALIAAAPAVAQNAAEASIVSADGTNAEVTISNPFPFAIKVVHLRLEYRAADGSAVYVGSGPGLVQDIEPESEWRGTVTFPDAGDQDIQGADGISVAAGVDLDELEPPVRAAIAAGRLPEIAAQLAIVKPRVAPVSRAARFHAEGIAASGADVARYFNRERIDGLVTDLENALCEGVSQQMLAPGSQSARTTRYQELGTFLREHGLHITCMNREAKLSAARMLLAGDRPQDAALFRESGPDGELLPEWRPVVMASNLALARAAATLDVAVFSSIRPAIEALNEAHRLEPENPQVSAVADLLIPKASQFIQLSSEPLTRDLDSARTLITLMRPTWDGRPGAMDAYSAFAGALLEQGLAFCGRREFVNARNEFVRGERILGGVPNWEAQAGEINRCRAMGSLQEGRELAALVTDNDAPARGLAKLEEAQSRFDIPQADVDAFKADISLAWVAVANRLIEENLFPGAANAIRQAAAVSPTGDTDAIRESWLRYAEQRYRRGGFFMTGADVEDAREALARAGEVDPDRISAAAGNLTRAYYGYRVGFPVGIVLLLLLAGLYLLAQKRRAKQLERMADDL